MILFDTDACIEILRGHEKVAKRRKEYPLDKIAILEKAVQTDELYRRRP